MNNEGNEELITKIVLGEIAGKNQAIQAYDKLIWTVRTGFLTLFFAGWGIILKSVVDNSASTGFDIGRVLLAMLLITTALSAGGIIIDQSYVRRKFRVIYALDSLLSKILINSSQINTKIDEISKYIQVSGDKRNDNYLQVSGYKNAWMTGLAVYLIPVVSTFMGLLLLWK